MVGSTPFRLERQERKQAANQSKTPGSRSTHYAPTSALADSRNKNRQKILS